MLLGEPEPAEPLALIRPRPQGGIVCPQATHFVPGAPIVERRTHGRGEGSRQGRCLLGDFGGCSRLTCLLHGGEQLVKGLGEQLHPFIQQRVGDLGHRDPHLRQRVHGVVGLFNVLREPCPHTTMVPEGVERRGRHSVDGIGTDEFLDVHHVAVGGILGTRAGPQDPLCLRTLIGQGLPARAMEHVLIELIRLLGIGDGHLAQQAAQQGSFTGPGGGLEPLAEQGVDRRVDAADEEAGHAGHMAQVAALRGAFLEPGDIGAHHLLVCLLRK